MHFHPQTDSGYINLKKKKKLGAGGETFGTL